MSIMLVQPIDTHQGAKNTHRGMINSLANQVEKFNIHIKKNEIRAFLSYKYPLKMKENFKCKMWKHKLLKENIDYDKYLHTGLGNF